LAPQGPSKVGNLVVMAMRYQFVIALLAAIVTVSCGDSTYPRKQQWPSVGDLISAADTLVLGGYSLTLEHVLVYADEFPPCNVNSCSLTILADVVEVRGQPIQSAVSVDSLWVVREQQVWSETPDAVHLPAAKENVISIQSSGGPLSFKPGPVVLVFGVIDSSGTLSLVKKAGLDVPTID
jgi:hypothetical protein